MLLAVQELPKLGFGQYTGPILNLFLKGLDICEKSCKIKVRAIRKYLEEDLANIKSQIKRNKQNDAARKRNRVYRGSARTMIRKALVSLKSGKQEESKAEVLAAISTLDHAATKGVLHKNNAARRKSRLMARFNALKD